MIKSKQNKMVGWGATYHSPQPTTPHRWASQDTELKVLLGDPWGQYLEDGWFYSKIDRAKVILIINQPKITIEETIKLIDHEYMHYIFDNLFDGKEKYDVNYVTTFGVFVRKKRLIENERS